jgi:hypothetical protein
MGSWFPKVNSMNSRIQDINSSSIKIGQFRFKFGVLYYRIKTKMYFSRKCWTVTDDPSEWKCRQQGIWFRHFGPIIGEIPSTADSSHVTSQFCDSSHVASKQLTYTWKMPTSLHWSTLSRQSWWSQKFPSFNL